MNYDDFLVELEDILQREEPCQKDDVIDDYEEWDSLSKMSLIAYYDINFSIKLSLSSFDNLKTVADLVKLAGDKIQ